ncbi:hypothetical protein BO78DRAFT_326213 [Aspergillus sclerotiicarbonarius CBS 121057]|uniref:Zn(2)-C6 fungal-type domain-containing protein n=1 Tax=Aspergillus sclerotiicarbonarius (strain CBS 121057 / IBT 28362) TaxID=1448318 RepID=A0A319DW38_ASPSB|nr:hypothetical protein BO78DRAFT_326213 [Aspergillus sclerotiicarbonarius CBS 121057]
MRIYTRKRSATGCRTCRRRHVKCDEYPGACRNCTSTGRTCDGYNRCSLPIGRKSILPRGAISRVPDPPGFHSAMTSDERMCFIYFQNHTAPSLAGLFGSDLWDRLALQACYMEPALYHAAVALGAAHHDTGAKAVPRPITALKNSIWHQFALEQLGRSFMHLQRRGTSQDPEVFELTVMCCLLFVTLELVLGHYENAWKHLHGGLQVLREWETSSTRRMSPPVDNALLTTFVHLEIQASYFGGPVPPRNRGDASGYLTPGTPEMPIQNIHGARWALDMLTKEIVHFARFCSTASPSAADQSARERHILSQLDQCAVGVQRLRRRKFPPIDARERIALDLLQLKQQGLKLTLGTCYLPVNDPRANRYISACKELVSFAASILKKSSDFPDLSMDIGVIPPLFIVAQRCRDMDTRLSAIEALRHGPYREGPWDSKLLAAVALQTVKIESVISGEKHGFVPCTRGQVERPPSNGFILVSEDRCRARMPYRVGSVDKEWWFSVDDDDSGSSMPPPGSGHDTCDWIRFLPSHLEYLHPQSHEMQ